MAITSCKDKRTEDFIAGARVREFQGFERQAAKTLARLHSAVRLGDLRYPPANRFEALKGDRVGQYSIRINDRWRICFRWAPSGGAAAGADSLLTEGDAIDVEIVDYH